MATIYQSFFWKFLQLSYGPFLKKKFSLKVREDRAEPKPPYIFLGNHAHRSDPFILGCQMRFPLNYMANVEAATLLQKIGGNLVGVFAKKKGMPDFMAVRMMFELLKNGHAIGIFPEGDRSWDGETAELIKNIPNLLKMAKVPIRLGRLRGNYLCLPRWADSERQGSMFIDFTTIQKEELDEISKPELYKKISQFLYRNDIKDPELLDLPFNGHDLAVGIQFLIWLCPVCHAHDTIRGEGDIIGCSHCRTQWKLDAHARISPFTQDIQDLKDWSDWQKREIGQYCAIDNMHKPLTVSADTELHTETEYKFNFYANGELVLFKDRVVFSPENSPQPQLNFENKKIQYYVDNFNRSFLFSYGDERYKLFFKGKNASKWIFFLNYLQK